MAGRLMTSHCSPPSFASFSRRPHRSSSCHRVFTMMMDPETILQAVERSDRLNRLQRRICRPLDKPLIPKVLAAEQLDFDREIDLDDSMPELDELVE